MPVQVSYCEIVFYHENDGLHQMLLRLIFPPSHTQSKSAIGLSIFFNVVKVCSAEQALRDSYLIRCLQSTDLTHTLRHS